jgi:hypothetical protein
MRDNYFLSGAIILFFVVLFCMDVWGPPPAEAQSDATIMRYMRDHIAQTKRIGDELKGIRDELSRIRRDCK